MAERGAGGGKREGKERRRAGFRKTPKGAKSSETREQGRTTGPALLTCLPWLSLFPLSRLSPIPAQSSPHSQMGTVTQRRAAGWPCCLLNGPGPAIEQRGKKKKKSRVGIWPPHVPSSGLWSSKSMALYGFCRLLSPPYNERPIIWISRWLPVSSR
ncbi:hypothetical protein BDP81DRAFT_427354 [Colletotrichum phormii]|uniref:Uncharacterized protein n=1 Tax=Colletotrichum phormii TaxID=359342 RepID=A0AAI9ZT72_9PEZI|nr:uncharacterized protein BDP81DRAFT_427354 [Colletotrichum phormii]KAK1637380.1 hypothetical protein BDP81DRAFT_427354 [Colletotrichum phormii]